ncbi:hypothetical protein ACWDBP_46675 [Streptomyces sp. NPDC001233]
MSTVLENGIDWLSRCPRRRAPPGPPPPAAFPPRPCGAFALTGKPVAVIGTVFCRHGGVWAQTEARRRRRSGGAPSPEAAAWDSTRRYQRQATRPAMKITIYSWSTSVLRQRFADRSGLGSRGFPRPSWSR